MAKLYEITNEYKNFIQMVENDEIPTEAIKDTLDSIQGDIEIKMDSIACIIKNLSADVSALKQEELNLSERRTSKEKNIDSLKKYITNNMSEIGIEKIETSKNCLTFRKSKQFKVYDDEKFMNEYPQFVKIEEKKSIMKKEAKEAILKNDEVLKFCEILENKNLQIK